MWYWLWYFMAICYLFCVRFCVSLYTTATCTISRGFNDHLLYQRVCKAPKIEVNESLNSAVMRSVPQRLKSFQMSLQLLLVRIFGSIPGPILMGMFIDRSCVLWQVDEGRGPRTPYFSGERGDWSERSVNPWTKMAIEDHALFMIIAKW